jgi:hypothetical protein
MLLEKGEKGIGMAPRSGDLLKMGRL